MSVFGGDLLDFQGTNSFQNSCGGCLDADCKNSMVDKAVNTHVVVVLRRIVRISGNIKLSTHMLSSVYSDTYFYPLLLTVIVIRNRHHGIVGKPIF